MDDETKTRLDGLEGRIANLEGKEKRQRGRVNAHEKVLQPYLNAAAAAGEPETPTET